MKLVLDGCFDDFDISKTKGSIVATNKHTVTVFEYNANIKHEIKNPGTINVRYYPHGNQLVTTSNEKGIGIWDIYNLNQIYHYNDEVYEHAFTHRNTIFATTFSGIKIYDLRCRTNSGYMPLGGIKGFDLCGDSFCVFTSTKIIKGNIKRMTIDATINVDDVVSVKHIDSHNFFYVQVRNKIKYLRTNNHEYDKVVSNSKMLSINEYVGLYGEENIAYFTLGNMHTQTLDKNISKALYNPEEDLIYTSTSQNIVSFQPRFDDSSK